MAWRGSNVETEVRHLDDPDNEIYDFCFTKTIALIQPGDAYWLFLSLAVFAADTSREALAFVSGLDRMRADEGTSKSSRCAIKMEIASAWNRSPARRQWPNCAVMVILRPPRANAG
jgi:hypothetical protein